MASVSTFEFIHVVAKGVWATNYYGVRTSDLGY